MDRRGFLQSILVAAVAPAIVRADSLMRIIPTETTIFIPDKRPLLLVAERIYSSHTWAGSGSRLGVGLMLDQQMREHIRRYYGRAHNLQMFEDTAYDPSAKVTETRLIASFTREIPAPEED